MEIRIVLCFLCGMMAQNVQNRVLSLNIGKMINQICDIYMENFA